MYVEIDHVAMVARDMDHAVKVLRDQMGLTLKDQWDIEPGKVRGAFFPIGHGNLEVVQPLDSDSGPGRYLREHGEGWYQVSLRTEKLAQTFEYLQKNGIAIARADLNPPPKAGRPRIYPSPAATMYAAFQIIQGPNRYAAAPAHDGQAATRDSAQHDATYVEIDHAVMVVKDLDGAVKVLRDQMGLTLRETREIPRSKVRAAFFPIGYGNLEVIQPLDPQSEAGKHLAKHGEGWYQVSLRTNRIEQRLADLRARGIPCDRTDMSPPLNAGRPRFYPNPPATLHAAFQIIEGPNRYAAQ